jgi:hypothetical protein
MPRLRFPHPPGVVANIYQGRRGDLRALIFAPNRYWSGNSARFDGPEPKQWLVD